MGSTKYSHEQSATQSILTSGTIGLLRAMIEDVVFRLERLRRLRSAGGVVAIAAYLHRSHWQVERPRNNNVGGLMDRRAATPSIVI
jgi:hypothetical protein